jgi:uncharacterized protein YecE (DUF72 family)
VPEGFRFAVKLPRAITHDARLAEADSMVGVFLEQVNILGEKLGPLLIQLPPSLAYDARVAGRFLEALRARFDGGAVCEPRHASWFRPAAESLLASFKIARAAADPAPVAGADEPGGWEGLRYYRWHGSPVTYWSNYGAQALASLTARLNDSDASPCWCIFDNTANGAATTNALALKSLLEGRDCSESEVC